MRPFSPSPSITGTEESGRNFACARLLHAEFDHRFAIRLMYCIPMLPGTDSGRCIPFDVARRRPEPSLIVDRPNVRSSYHRLAAPGSGHHREDYGRTTIQNANLANGGRKTGYA